MKQKLRMRGCPAGAAGKSPRKKRNDGESGHRVTARALRLLVSSLMALLAMAAAIVEPAYATDFLPQASRSVFGTFYGIIQGVALGLAALALVAGAYFFFAGDEKSVSRAKNIVIWVVIGLAVVFLAPAAVRLVYRWRNDSAISWDLFPGA